jgi:3-oxoacyl-[acyl-carrier-protein] synthase II
MSRAHRVVVTGMGVVSPCGNGVEAFWSNVAGGISGIGPISRFDAGDLPSRIAGEVRGFDPLDVLSRGKARRTDRVAQFALAAAVEAVAQSHLPRGAEHPLERIGVLIGTGIGGFESTEEQIARAAMGGARRISPYMLPRILPNMPGAEVAIEFAYGGPNFCVVSACATANNCIGESMRMIQNGRADAMVCGATEAPLTPAFVGGFCAMRALSVRNDEPPRACRPFDAGRDGFVIAEGAGVLVLESLDHAHARGAEPLAELCGYATNCDAYHITAMRPGAERMTAVIRAALDDAGLAPEALDYINAHGTSTAQNDAAETAAIHAALGAAARSVSISSTKSCTGHLLGASGAVEAIATVMALRTGCIPPTINYEHPDPQCDLDYTPNRSRSRKAVTGLSSSFGFGGHNACLVFRRFE